MIKNQDTLIAPSDLQLALALLSRLPVSVPDISRMGRAAWAYPLVGLLLSALAAFAGFIMLTLGVPASLAALVSLVVSILATGAMHEDGLADSADGLWGGWDRERRLEIMKDSRIGTYGVVALIISFAARWGAIGLLFSASTTSTILALITAGMLSRATMPLLMAALPHARQDGLSQSVGHVPTSSAALGVGIAISLSFILVGGAAFWVVVFAGIATLIIGKIAKARIGGQTGDVLGASQQISEIIILFSLTASFT